MSPVIPIMGFERGEKERGLNNRDRQNRIQSMKPRIVYENPTAKKAKVNPECYKTISAVMSEKLRIRKKRLDLNQRQGPPDAKPIDR